MRKKILFTGLLAMVLVVGLMSTAFAQVAHTSVAPPTSVAASYRYAVKFVCGCPEALTSAFSTLPLITGIYATAINVHNPSIVDRTIWFAKKVAVTQYSALAAFDGTFQEPGPVTPFYRAQLGGNQAFEIDCNEINYMIALADATSNVSSQIAFSKGFVVIMSPVELDVAAVYTQGYTTLVEQTTATIPTSIDVEYILGKTQKATITFPLK